MFRPTLLKRIPVIPRFRQNHTTAHSLSALETRWSKLPEAEKGAIADSLAEAQKGDWKKLTLDQKRAVLPNLRTQTPEWKAATESLSIEQKQNPFSGVYAKELKK
ncbi:hypothetical protein HDV01_001146 [Terramyces sp. JEL0728]|nr:hypothetical protein HDV01_001146 [Terramyces sp. JEL0728]